MVPADGYLPALQEWCTANGVVLIADEIQSGMARTGNYFASEHFGWEPDLVLSAKGIAGGLPLAGVTGRAEIMDASHPGGLGGTFGGNPVACAAAIAVFEPIERDDLLAEAERIESDAQGRRSSGCSRSYHIIGEVRGIGRDDRDRARSTRHRPRPRSRDADAVTAIAAYAAQQGVLFLTAGTYGNVLRFLPSLAITDASCIDAASACSTTPSPRSDAR